MDLPKTQAELERLIRERQAEVLENAAEELTGINHFNCQNAIITMAIALRAENREIDDAI